MSNEDTESTMQMAPLGTKLPLNEPVLGSQVNMHMGASTVHVYFTVSHEQIALHPDHWNSLESLLDGLKDTIPKAVAEHAKT